VAAVAALAVIGFLGWWMKKRRSGQRPIPNP